MFSFKLFRNKVAELLDERSVRHQVSSKKGYVIFLFEDRSGLSYFPACVNFVLKEYLETDSLQVLIKELNTCCSTPETPVGTQTFRVTSLWGKYSVLVDIGVILKQGRRDRINKLVSLAIDLFSKCQVETYSVRENIKLINFAYEERVTLRESLEVCRVLESYGILESNGGMRTYGRNVNRSRLYEFLRELNAR